MNKYTISLKRTGYDTARERLIIVVSESFKLPWSQTRPMIAFAWRHVRHSARGRWDELNKMWGSVKLALTNGNCWRGRAGRYRCLVRVGNLDVKPFKSRYPCYQDMPEFWVANWQERFVGLVTHELWHIHQPGHGRNAEFNCELVEWDAVEAWRKHQGYTFTPPVDGHESEAETESAEPAPPVQLQDYVQT